MHEEFQTELNDISRGLNVDKGKADYKKFSYTTYPLLHNEALYVLDLKDNKVIYQRGIKDLLGYEEEEFDYDTPFNIVHPDDLPVVRKVLMSTLEFSQKHGITTDSTFRISCRYKKKDGSYIKVQRTSGVCRLNSNRTLRSHYSVVQDISYLGLSNAVRWYWDSPTADLSGYRKFIDVSPVDLFSKRELEVFELLKNGLDSKTIAETLGLSYHTIIGYRKNMLHKTSCRNTFELLQMFEMGSLYNTD